MAAASSSSTPRLNEKTDGRKFPTLPLAGGEASPARQRAGEATPMRLHEKSDGKTQMRMSIAGASVRRSNSFYKIIDGTIFNSNLMDEATLATGDGRPLSLEKAKQLWTSTSSYTGADEGLRQISDIDLRTIERIVAETKCDTLAKLFLDEAVRGAKKEAAAATPRQPRRSSLGGRSAHSASRRSPKSKAKATPKSAENPYQEIQQLEDRISEARTVKQVEGLQKKMEKMLVKAAAHIEKEERDEAAAERSASPMRRPVKRRPAGAQARLPGRPSAAKRPAQNGRILKRPSAAAKRPAQAAGAGLGVLKRPGGRS